MEKGKDGAAKIRNLGPYVARLKIEMRWKGINRYRSYPSQGGGIHGGALRAEHGTISG